MQDAGPAKTLKSYWHPIATSAEVVDQPRAFKLLDEPVTAFRDERGVAAFKDLCIHRGTALSLGHVSQGRLTCAYHGWQFDRDGACVMIPSLPSGSTIPKKARAVSYRVTEAYGLVWVALADPVAPLPSWPGKEWGDPSWRIVNAFHFQWQTSAGRAVENFMDISHFPFVHTGLLGHPARAVVEPFDLRRTEHGITFHIDAVEPNEVHHAAEETVRREYSLYAPFTIHVKKSVASSPQQTIVTMIAAPTTTRSTDVYVCIGRNYDRDPANDAQFAAFTGEVMAQDQRIVESQRPEEIPVSLREELHLKVPDASGVAYRRLLGEIDDIAPYLP